MLMCDLIRLRQLQAMWTRYVDEHPEAIPTGWSRQVWIRQLVLLDVGEARYSAEALGEYVPATSDPWRYLSNWLARAGVEFE